ncbi:MAG: flagellar type III secretion system protein FlhB [Burkholderiaceae bacterium]
MASSNDQDRNLPASERRIRKAREDGQVARSRDFGHFAAMAAAGVALLAGSPWLAGFLREALAQGLRFDAATLAHPQAMGERLSQQTATLLWVVLPFGAVMVAAALAGSLALSGWNWTWKPLVPKFEKLNPLTGFAKLLSKDKLIDALKGSALALILGTIGALYLKSHSDALGGVLTMALPAAIGSAAQTLLGGLALLLIALAGFALLDAPLQLHLHAQRLKMSRQEVKQEHKELEGNSEVKSKVRALMRDKVRRRMMAAVPGADLVVMNPTHYAVALKYEDGKMAAPRVVAKGADLIALAIRDLAKESKVPVLQAPVLARALYAHAELDREVPAALFAAVAQVLAYVYQLRAAMAGGMAMPGELPELNVPAELDPHAGVAV